MNTEPLGVGVVVFNSLYGRRRGVIVAEHPREGGEPVRLLGGGAVSMGGSADYDAAFPDPPGAYVARLIPECILRGPQWAISPDAPLCAAAVAAALRLALAGEEERAAQIAEHKRKLAAERERIKTAPEYAHLKPGAAPAVNIRRDLKKQFPGVSFSVRSSRGSVRVNWTDGPTVDAVRAVVDRYAEGRFDSSRDTYESSDEAFPRVYGGARYVFASRDISPALWAETAAKLGLAVPPVNDPGDRGGYETGADYYDARNLVYREAHATARV